MEKLCVICVRRDIMRTIGIDLAITSAHKAVILDHRGQALSPVLQVHSNLAELEALLRRARRGAATDTPLRVVLEATGLAWFPVASFFIQRGVTVYRVNPQQPADLRRFYSKHAKSDRIDCRVLARLPFVNPDKLYPLHLPDAAHLAGQRWCRQREALKKHMTAITNRVQAWERMFWPDLEGAVGHLFTPWMQRFREEWYDPWRLAAAKTMDLASWLVTAGVNPEQAHTLAERLQHVAQHAIGLFGTPQGRPSPYVDYVALQDEVLRELRLLAHYQEELERLQHRIHQLYDNLYPDHHLESIKGVGRHGAPVFAFFVGDVRRFPNQKAFRNWSGLVPRSNQSSNVHKKGLSITRAGPDLVKKYAYLAAETARWWDPQIAAIYYDQIMHKGNHYKQAVCACATHMLDRIHAVLRDRRPYELRDVDGRTVTVKEAQAIIAQRYAVPQEVRQRNNQRVRKARADARAERQRRTKRKRRNSPRWQEASAGALPQPEELPPWLCTT